MTKSTTHSISSDYNTLAHEMIAKEEDNIAIFFGAFAIQLYMRRNLLMRKNMKTPFFITRNKDVVLYASQRFLIRNIIMQYNDITEYIEQLFIDTDGTKYPEVLFFQGVNKAFLIRQIFQQTDQVLKKYDFINDFLLLKFSEINFEELKEKMSTLTIKEQILILVRIFVNMKDEFEDRNRTLGVSFVENIIRQKQLFIERGFEKSLEYSNLDRLYINFK